MIDEVVPAALDGERLDRVVAIVTGASRADAAVLVTAGGAEVDGAVVTTGKVRLREGQAVRVDTAKLPQVEAPAADAGVAFTVVYADDDVVVIDKPAGLVVHPGAGNPTGTLVNGLLARFPEIASVGDWQRPGIVHRLDVGTTGLMVVARSEPAYELLVAALSSREVERTYRTLVWGVPASAVGVIDAPIATRCAWQWWPTARWPVPATGCCVRTATRMRWPRCGAVSRRAAPTRSVFTSPPSVTRWWATACTEGPGWVST